MLRHIAYVSHSRTALDTKILSDILEVSRRNNDRDGITGVLMYHDELFFQILEGEDIVVKQCFNRISHDPRHSGIAATLEEPVGARSFPYWLMGYVGPDEIGTHTGGAMKSLACLKESAFPHSDRRGYALTLAKIMFEQFSKR